MHDDGFGSERVATNGESRKVRKRNVRREEFFDEVSIYEKRENRNVVIIGGFKEYCAVTFFKGMLLKDASHILTKPGENTQAGRLVRFTSVQEILDLEAVLEAYIHEAVEVEQSGLKVALRDPAELTIPDELQDAFDANSALEAAFGALTPGRQRAYVLHFSAPKQSATRKSRIENYTQRILDGIGFNDCVCGLSARLPACDGSHKHSS